MPRRKRHTFTYAEVLCEFGRVVAEEEEKRARVQISNALEHVKRQIVGLEARIDFAQAMKLEIPAVAFHRLEEARALRGYLEKKICQMNSTPSPAPRGARVDSTGGNGSHPPDGR